MWVFEDRASQFDIISKRGKNNICLYELNVVCCL